MARILMFSHDKEGRVHDAELLAQKLARDGYEAETAVTILAWGSARESCMVGGVAVERFRDPLPALPLRDLLLPFLVPGVVRARGPFERIVAAHTGMLWGAWVARRMTGAVVEFHLNGLLRDIARTRGRAHWLYQYLSESLTARIPDRWVVINETTRAYAHSLGIPDERIVIRAPDTITMDASLVIPDTDVRAHYNLPTDVPLVLSVGRLEKEKGFEELLTVFAQAAPRESTLVIAGDGALKEVLQAQARERGIGERVRFVGYLTRPDLWALYAAADAFVLLSKSEALGLVVWEAMHAGLPVIGRPVGGIKESIGKDGERGFLWNTEDGPEAFGRTLARALTDTPGRAAMLERAKAFVAQRLHA